MHSRLLSRRFLIGVALTVSFVLGGGMSAVHSAAPVIVPTGGRDVPGLKAVRDLWQQANFQFTPEVRAAFLKYVKAETRQRLTAAGKSVPPDFWAWLESDPELEASVFGARQDPTGVVLMLRSLEIDLGQDNVRKKYTQLALATAIVFAKEGDKADLSPRPLLKLSIGGDPRQPVNTKDSQRKLDLNDHIINFLNENTVEEEVVVGQKEEPAELKYDAKGIALPPGKPKLVPVKEKRTRTLYAADVLANPALQAKFNAYLKEKGQNVTIDCGDNLVHWNSHDMVRGEQHKKLAEALKLFQTAYEAKGLLPDKRDPLATPAERCAYAIRNYEYKFSDELQATRKWPRYPLTAPWPTLTLLVANDQPLREREERWLAFRDKNEFKTYGEYIGGVAQQFDMQSARRITPYPFQYGSVQMMLKDGGVCGTMANISARSHCTLGIPSCTAGQPGHCALIIFAFDPKTNTYNCHGGQYATGGDDKTHPHTPWFFGDVDDRRDMIYHQSIAWAVNYGMRAYLDSTLAYQFYRQLNVMERQAHGMQLLENALAANPYNFFVIDTGLTLAQTPGELVQFWKTASGLLAGVDKPGCPKTGLYVQTIHNKLFAGIGKLPVPSETGAAAEIQAFLLSEKCDNQNTLAQYKVAVSGLPALLSDAETALRNHLKSSRALPECEQTAALVTAAAERIPDKGKKKEWANACWQAIQGHECFLDKKGNITADPTVPALAKLAGQKARPEVEQFQAVLDQLTQDLKTHVAGERTPAACGQLAKTLDNVAKQLKDADQKRKWLDGLAQTIQGHEEFTVKNKKQRDPCADTIANLLKTPAEPVKK